MAVVFLFSFYSGQLAVRIKWAAKRSFGLSISATKGSSMISIVSGLVVFGAGAAGLWHFMPTDGQVHPLAKMPFLDSLIPIAIVTALALGTALIIAGIV